MNSSPGGNLLFMNRTSRDVDVLSPYERWCAATGRRPNDPWSETLFELCAGEIPTIPLSA